MVDRAWVCWIIQQKKYSNMQQKKYSNMQQKKYSNMRTNKRQMFLKGTQQWHVNNINVIFVHITNKLGGEYEYNNSDTLHRRTQKMEIFVIVSQIQWIITSMYL